jgi:glycosyltransferase involved in cell wall biosynthesis
MKIAFIDRHPFEGDDIDKRPLSGGVSSYCYLSREFVKLGHTVTVYTFCERPGMYAGVEWKRFIEYEEDSKRNDTDAVIVLREPLPLLFWKGTGKRILWVMDHFDQPAIAPLYNPDALGRCDEIVTLADWHKETFDAEFERESIVIQLAINQDQYPDVLPEPEGRRLVFTSVPWRGLPLALSMFPEIRKRVPDAEFHSFSSMAIYNQSDADYRHLFTQLDQPGVIDHGSVPKEMLSKELAKCRVFAYANTFIETGCTAIREGMAAGCVPVTSDIASLPGIVGPGGIIIPGMPGSVHYRMEFTEACVRLLTNDKMWREYAEAGFKLAQEEYTWEKVALDWVNLIRRS